MRLRILWLSASLATTGLVVASPAAEAGHCHDQGNMTAMVGGVATVGARLTPNGAVVCADPPNQEQGVNVYVGDDPSRIGAVVSGDTCGGLACQGIPPVGAEASLPTTHVDPPGDANGWTGATVGTAGGLCVWPAGTPTCQGGGVTEGGYVTLPRPVDPAVDYAVAVTWWTQWPGWCIEFISWAGVEGAAVLCAFGLGLGMVATVQDLTTRAPGWL